MAPSRGFADGYETRDPSDSNGGPRVVPFLVKETSSANPRHERYPQHSEVHLQHIGSFLAHWMGTYGHHLMRQRLRTFVSDATAFAIAIKQKASPNGPLVSLVDFLFTCLCIFVYHNA